MPERKYFFKLAWSIEQRDLFAFLGQVSSYGIECYGKKAVTIKTVKSFSDAEWHLKLSRLTESKEAYMHYRRNTKLNSVVVYSQRTAFVIGSFFRKFRIPAHEESK